MDKYTVETGLNKDGIPVIKCSHAYYDELIKECRAMIKASSEMRTLDLFTKTYPAVSVLSTMPLMSEILNAN